VPQQIANRRSGFADSVDNLDLDLPDGTPLLRGITFAPVHGGAVLITGPTGTGKSTLLRAMAGVWPFGRGEISMSEGRSLFVPQRPYLPLGTLTSALLYPQIDRNGFPAERLKSVLKEVGLDGVGRGIKCCGKLESKAMTRRAAATRFRSNSSRRADASVPR